MTSIQDYTLQKSPSGIEGLDEITGGGLPKGRPTLICGSAGCGKTLMAMEFLIRGITEYDEPGVFMAFEETASELTTNVVSLGFDLKTLQEQKKLRLDHVHVEASEIAETGEYDLEGLFIRLGYAIDSIGAKRVVLDTIESLFSGFQNEALLRAELRRLFRWLKDKGVTAIITAERGDGALTRQGLEEYVSDCVILLDHRVFDQVSTRRLRIVKYRGTTHGTNEYPFLIDKDGITVLPVTSLQLNQEVSTDRISSGVSKLDDMLGGSGFYRGSTVLVSGTAGTGKTSLASSFANATCLRGERCLYFAFEESPNQLMRNTSSIGIDLHKHMEAGLLKFHASRPTTFGIELHLATMHKMILEFDPKVVILDPVSNLVSAGTLSEAQGMLIRLIDFLKSRQITAFFTSLTGGGEHMEQTEVGVSSLVDTWLLVRELEHNGERNRGLYVLKSRGMAHSNQVREFIITRNGLDLVDVHIGPDGVLTGSARLMYAQRQEQEESRRRQEIERRQRELDRKRRLLEAQIAALRAEFEADEQEINRILLQEEYNQEVLRDQNEALTRTRMQGADNGNFSN